jgi:hypothetical protein
MGYFETFKGHLTKVDPLECVGNTCTQYMTPAACLPLYPVMQRLGLALNSCLTSRVKVFRYEEAKRERCVRTWEFNVREIVFIGDSAYVAERLEEVETWIQRFAISNQLPVDFIYSSDYFTGTSPKTSVMKKIQVTNQLKREVIWKGDAGSVALASLNKHLDHYSSMFGWGEDGKCESGCVGFGLERWLHAWNAKCGERQMFPNPMDKEADI